MHKTSVVILNWNGIDFLKKFIGTVRMHSTLPGTEIVIADNASIDGSAEWIEENHSDIRLIRLDKNHGFAAGYNLALQKTEAQYYILLNSDVEVTVNWIEPLISYLDSNPDVAACQPKIRAFNSRDHFEYAGAAGGFIDKYGYPFCRGRVFDHIEADNGQYNDTADVFWASGACMAIRSSAWEKCGGFDPDFFAHMEEIDLCWRFHKAGFRVTCVPESVVYHVGGGALPYSSPFKTYLNFRNSLYLLYKNLEDDKLMKILFARRLLDGIAAAKFLAGGKPAHLRSVWRAHMDFYRHLSELKKKRKDLRQTSVDKFVAPVLNKSVVFEFYARGNRTYSDLIK